MNDSANIELIIFKVFTGEATQEEAEAIKLWIRESEENEKQFYRLKNIWDVANPSFQPEDINLGQAYANVFSQITAESDTIVKRKSFIYYWQRIAAIIVLPLLALSVYFFISSTDEKQYVTEYQEVFSPYGTRSFLNLPDSSKVWLNAGSSIKYPVRFADGERRVTLIGEAYFKVKSDEKNPFIVHTEEIDIRATGTEFNVDAYKEDERTAVTLVAGKVNVKSRYDKTMQLRPNERINYEHSSEKFNLSKTDTYKWCSWKDGILAFRNDRLEYVFKRLGQMYNIDFVIKDRSVASYVYHATFEGESLDEILYLLELSAPLRYKKLAERKDQDNYYHKQIIEIYKRK
ncbi:MAG: FecR family protein [Dysgonomonas sp.]